MYAEDLIEILKKLPPDTIICKTSGEDGCDGLESAKYFPQFNILYLEPYWERRSKGYIDMADGDEMFYGQVSNCPFSKEELQRIRDLALVGKKIVDAKKDGRMHRIQVVSHIREILKRDGKEVEKRDFSTLVDGEWVSGMNPVNEKVVICDFKWESLKDA